MRDERGSETLSVSVIVPAHNEERHVGCCVRTAKRELAAYDLEVVVVDHQSNDGTREEARKAGAMVVPAPVESHTVSALRNEGVRCSGGEVLVFLDADVTLSDTWGARFAEIAGRLRGPSKVVTGSMCASPERATWLERVWFTERRQRPTHIGSGHLVIAREFFEKLGGFDEALVTGEDYDLAQRAIREGGEIRLDPSLVAIHHGFPTSLWQFARRELWHGLGDFASPGRFLHSKVAIASMLFLGLHVLALGGLLTGSTRFATACLLGVGIVVAAAAVLKFGPPRGIRWLAVLPLFYVYFASRSVGVFVAPTRGFRWRR